MIKSILNTDNKNHFKSMIISIIIGSLLLIHGLNTFDSNTKLNQLQDKIERLEAHETIVNTRLSEISNDLVTNSVNISSLQNEVKAYDTRLSRFTEKYAEEKLNFVTDEYLQLEIERVVKMNMEVK